MTATTTIRLPPELRARRGLARRGGGSEETCAAARNGPARATPVSLSC